MHIVIEVVIASVVSLAFAVAALFIGYFAYRSRRANERLAARPAIAPGGPDLLAEYRMLGNEIRGSLERATTTAKSMRDTVERGVR